MNDYASFLYSKPFTYSYENIAKYFCTIQDVCAMSCFITCYFITFLYCSEAGAMAYQWIPKEMRWCNWWMKHVTIQFVRLLIKILMYLVDVHPSNISDCCLKFDCLSYTLQLMTVGRLDNSEIFTESFIHLFSMCVIQTNLFISFIFYIYSFSMKDLTWMCLTGLRSTITCLQHSVIIVDNSSMAYSDKVLNVKVSNVFELIMSN